MRRIRSRVGESGGKRGDVKSAHCCRASVYGRRDADDGIEGRSLSSPLVGEVIIPAGYDAVKRRSMKTCLPHCPTPFPSSTTETSLRESSTLRQIKPSVHHRSFDFVRATTTSISRRILHFRSLVCTFVLP